MLLSLGILGWDELMQHLRASYDQKEAAKMVYFYLLLFSRAIETQNSGDHHPGKPHQGQPSKPTGVQPSFLPLRLNFPSLRASRSIIKNLPAHISALPAWWEGVLIFPSIKYTTALLIEEEKVPAVSGAAAVRLPPRFTARWHCNP